MSVEITILHSLTTTTRALHNTLGARILEVGADHFSHDDGPALAWTGNCRAGTGFVVVLTGFEGHQRATLTAQARPHGTLIAAVLSQLTSGDL